MNIYSMDYNSILLLFWSLLFLQFRSLAVLSCWLSAFPSALHFGFVRFFLFCFNFLVLHDAPGSPCYFPILSLESAISARSSSSFY